MEGKIDLSHPENFGLVYVLFQELATLFHPVVKDGNGNLNLNDAKSWKVQKLSENIQEESKIFASSDFEQEMVSEKEESDAEQFRDYVKKNAFHVTSCKKIIRILRGTPYKKKSEDGEVMFKFFFDIGGMNILCRLIGSKRNDHFLNWEKFSKNPENIKRVEKILIEHQDIIEKYRESVNAKQDAYTKPLIHINFRLSNLFGNEREVLTRLNTTFKERFIRARLETNLEIEFSEDNDVTQLHVEEIKLAEAKEADIAIWGSFDVMGIDELYCELHYSVIGSKYQDRIRKEFGSFAADKVTLRSIRNGDFCADLDQTLHLILAIESVLEEKFDAALSHLNQIPEDKKCDEAWFIQGTCLYEQGDEVEGIICWEKTLRLNENHLKAITNLTTYELRKAKKHTGDFLPIKKLLENPLFNNSSPDIKLRVGAILADIGENGTAEKFLKAAVEDGNLLGIEYAWFKLGQLKQEPSYFKNAALVSDEYEFHELCKSCIEEIGLSDIEKKKFFQDIYSKKGSNHKLRGLYREKDNDSDNKEDFGHFPLKIFGLKGEIKKKSERILETLSGENGSDSEMTLETNDGLTFDDVLICEGKEVVGSVLLCDEKGNYTDIMRLKLPSNNHGYLPIEDCLYPYFSNLRTIQSGEFHLFLSAYLVEDKRFFSGNIVRIFNEVTKEYFDLKVDESGNFMLEKNILSGWYSKEEETHLYLLVCLYTDSDEFVPLKSIKLLITDEEVLKEKVKKFIQYLRDESENNYFLAIANYLTDFYAYTDKDDVKRWLAGQLL